MNAIRITPALAAASAALVLAAPLGASPPAPVAGAGTVMSVVVTSVRVAGGNTITELVATGSLTGTVTGTFVVQRRQVTHASGRTNVKDFTVVTGTTPCGTGSFSVRVTATIDATGVFDGRGTIIRDSTNTANFHGNVRFAGPPGGMTFTYAGRYHCH